MEDVYPKGEYVTKSSFRVIIMEAKITSDIKITGFSLAMELSSPRA